MIRVLHLDHTARLSGGEIAFLRLVEATRSQVASYAILGENGPLEVELERSGIPVEVRAIDPGLRDFRREQLRTFWQAFSQGLPLICYVLRIVRRIRSIRPDLVHTHSLKAGIYGAVAARMCGVPVVWHLRDRVAVDYLPRPMVPVVRNILRWLPNHVIVDSRATLETIQPIRNASAIYPCIPESFFERVSALSAGSRDASVLRIGMIGRIAPWKGQHVFMEAFAAAFPGGKHEAWIIGAPLFGELEYCDSLRELSFKLGIADRLVWRGFQDDVAAELGCLDVLVHCSVIPEPFGLVVVEGMAAGLAVIATAGGGPLEIIDEGVDGLLVPPGDVLALARSLQRVAGDADLRGSLGRNARASSRRFSSSDLCGGVLGVYEAVLRGTPVSDWSSRPGRGLADGEK